jgi:UDP-arabinose 4-epimerase
MPSGESLRGFKAVFERALEAYNVPYGLHFVALRYFNAAGCDDRGEIGELHEPETHLIPSALQALTGARPELELYGTDYAIPDGTCIRDYIHVTDLAEAHVLALKHLANAGNSVALNLGTGRGSSVKEVLVPKRMASRRAGDPPALVADPTRAQNLLQWKATRSLEEIVRTAGQWMQCVGPATLCK